jgi:hypothetical protein
MAYAVTLLLLPPLPLPLLLLLLLMMMIMIMTLIFRVGCVILLLLRATNSLFERFALLNI